MDKDPAPSPLTNIDLIVLRAARVWGDETARGLWSRFASDRRASLRWGWESAENDDPDQALDRLRLEHAAQARPDLSRVHASWWLRALKEEPASVQRAVAANLPAGVAEVLREGLGLSADDLKPDRPAQPGAVQVAVALWNVRLVGDLPEQDDDPPVISALTRFDATTVARLIRTTGLARWALTTRALPEFERKDLDRLPRIRSLLADVDPRFVHIVARDIDGLAPDEPRPISRAGITTFARLLHAADPYRARWALQHLPYSTAKSLRVLMGPANRKLPMLVRWETELLRAAWTRLHEEGRLSDAWGAAP